MSFWQELNTRALSRLITSLDQAARDCQTAMRRFAMFGNVSHSLSAAYPDLRKLRSVIVALEQAARDGRSEGLNRRREAIGVPMRSSRRRSSKATDVEAAQRRQDAARELETARRHIGNAVQMLGRVGGKRALLTQLGETATFLGLAKDEARRG